MAHAPVMTEPVSTAGRTTVRGITVTAAARAVVLSAAAIVIGLIWDISWHRTIGRDTLFSPPHVLEYIAAIVAGVSCGWLILQTTFDDRRTADRASAVTFWGFRGPLGTWVTVWGTFAMLASAPFDDWWHNAYGLDVEILSPPHVILLFGMLAVVLGAVLMAVAVQNREGESSRRFTLLYTFASAMLLLILTTAAFAYTAFPNTFRGPSFYVVSAVAYILPLVVVARSARRRWPATTAALLYLGVSLGLSWTLQAFSAAPKLAPIYREITHMVPPPFPLLLVVPALVIDLLVRREQRRGWPDWGRALVTGPLALVAFFGVNWFWGDFLLSESARNALFAMDQWEYFSRPGSWQYEYWGLSRSTPTGGFDWASFAGPFGFAGLLSVASGRVGLWLGNWLGSVKR